MAGKAINPIIPGFAPDPSCIRVGDTYYLVNSTFSWFPGLPIYTSQDLVSWKHIGNAINRLSQGLDFSQVRTRVNPPDEWGEAMTMTGGLYAPTIRHRNGTFYVVCTNVVHHPTNGRLDQRKNFLVTSTDPQSDQWSDPIWFDFDGIDTCIFWDDDTGRAYIHGTAIRLFEIDLQTGRKLSDEKELWPGTGGAYPEGPHLFRRPDGYYYLLISEGGCFEDHAITGARSRNLWGPYEAFEQNPILTARGTDEYVRNIGHSDLFQDAEGDWWAVALGIRKDKKGRYLMGRETFLTPAVWGQGEYPRISQIKVVPETLGKRALPAGGAGATLTAAPGVDWLYLRNPDLAKHQLSDPGGAQITLTASSADLTQGGPHDYVTFVGKRMRLLEGGMSSVTLKSTEGGEPENIGGLRAGLALYKDECRFARVYFDFGTGEVVFEVRNVARQIQREERKTLDLAGESLRFQITSSEELVRFEYSLGTVAGESDAKWAPAGEMDAIELTGLDFTGPVIGVFAVGDVGEQVVFEGLEVQ